MMVPAGGTPRLSVVPVVLTVTGTLPVLVFAGLAASVAFTMMVLVPATVGVPVMTQLTLSVRPVCNVPLPSAQV